MPIIEIHLREGRTPEQKRALHEKVAHAAAEAVDCDLSIVRILITEHRADEFSVGGKLKAFKPETAS
jgi:4-oxalocrotonate tautomerase